ncbi:molybdopterin synthase [Halorubrum vacuolatum]|uniref:Molybdopterin synthase subunit MoaE /molybdopterin guanine dinucleotide biosynthesis accessory protein MobB n=1 Tax=Halorubrum vacuolatum TaxID=63740 RepID=A0A238VWL0_HALVU|nr:molybdopterin synthase [Halorubrum vacuolatum]SNR38571.1 molybdopterin synthase subunit MoaE /molybdopterin guanine dinucleotide biosynthesis accessory protein MobB [Halorubrum vacuolatum]
MQPISILGPDADRLADRLVERLDGRVAVVTRADAGPTDDPSPGVTSTDGGVSGTTLLDAESEPVATELSLSPDGTWSGTGRADGFDTVLDRVAPDHDYCVAVGYSRLRVPTVLLGDERGAEDVPGTVIVTATSAETVDLDDLVASLADAEPWITVEELTERVREAAGEERSGAIATFTGRVRAKDAPDDDRTSHLAFEKYEGVARERMDAISEELTDRPGVFEVLMHHRTGVIEAGEDIVFVVVLAGHREEAFRTVEDGINRLKDEVPIFKKETTEREEFWVHQRE